MKFFALVLSLFIGIQSASAVEIKEVLTPRGLKVWLVESHSLPMISVNVSFRAGSSFDPEMGYGLSALSAGMLTEGVGHYSASEFKKELDSIGAQMGSGADRLNISVNMVTLTEQKERAFELLSLALNEPRLKQADFDRLKDATLSAIEQSKQNPGNVASKSFEEALFFGMDHPYGRPVEGYAEIVDELILSDANWFLENHLTRSNMVISVVGDISVEEVSRLVDKSLSQLPEGRERNKIEQNPWPMNPQIVRQTMNIPQSHIVIGHRSVPRDHPDYYTFYVMNYILGGGGFNSRLMEEIREKRGLAYSVYSYIEPLPFEGSFRIGAQTKNEDAETTVSLIKKEIDRLKNKGVTEEEFQGAIQYLTGSFPLRLDSNSKILQYLSVMQMEGLGIDYLDLWVKRIESVTREDVNRVAKELLNPNGLITVVVGNE